MSSTLKRITRFGLILSTLFASSLVWAQRSRLVSDIDQDLNIEKVLVGPLVDNVSGIYAKPLSAQLISLVNEDRQWEMLPWPEMTDSSPETYEESAEKVQSLLDQAGAQALLLGRVSRGPNGVNIKLDLFAGKEGLLLSQETLSNYKGYETSELIQELKQLYYNMKSKLPYGGVVLSRRGQMVTINVGTRHGVRENSNVSVVQIVKLTRHPKFNFVVQADKEILGRIRVQKAEESLSFGLIELERSENLVQPGMKLMPVNFVDYPVGKIPSQSEHIYGETPKEWAPKATPTFGKVGVSLGVGSYSLNNTLDSVGAVSAAQSLTPSIHLEGEMWLTSIWFLQMDLHQYVLQVKNNYSGSTPANLSVASSQWGLVLGYNFLMSPDFFGPKFYLGGGFGRFASTVDTSSPLAYTSITMGGMKFVFGGEFPVSPEIPMNLGAKLNYFLLPQLTENPLSSGDSSNPLITSFTAYGRYHLSPTMNVKGDLSYELYSSSFSGVGGRGADSASSLSHTLTTVSLGLEVLF